jgi:hypothetical protein
LALDRRVKGLKRIELKIPSSNIEGKNLNVKVRLRGQRNWREGY